MVFSILRMVEQLFDPVRGGGGGAFEQLFDQVSGGIEQTFSKNSNASGVSRERCSSFDLTGT